jgi:hypothetical protein
MRLFSNDRELCITWLVTYDISKPVGFQNHLNQIMSLFMILRMYSILHAVHVEIIIMLKGITLRKSEI